MRTILVLIMIITSDCIIGQGTSVYFGQNPPHDIPQLFAPDIVSVKGRFDYGISFSPDCKELAYGVLDIKDESGRIYYSKVIDDKWTKPEIACFLGNSSMFLPFFTPDGESLLYTQTQQDSANHITDIWIANKHDNGWDKPVKMPEPINSDTREGNVCMTLNKTLYFSSGRDCIGKADCPAVIYSSRLNGGKYLTAEKEIQINLKGDNESIFVSADESFAIISNISNSKTNSDLYISYRDTNNEWSSPIGLDSMINSSDWELRPFVSMDNKYLFFTRISFRDNRPIDSDIYWVNIEKFLDNDKSDKGNKEK